MESNDTTQTKQQNKYNFEKQTYNGISVIFETNTGYFNATKMCVDNRKQWRHYKITKMWSNKVEAFNRFYGKKSCGGILPDGKISFEPENVANEWRGEYVHPKLIHFVAEWCSDDYAFKVAELMDSINEQVHNRVEMIGRTDVPENTKPLFEATVSQITHQIATDNENKQCWGIRETDKFDYLDSWDKSQIFNLVYQFKQDLIKQVNFSFEQLKQDYPQLFA